MHREKKSPRKLVLAIAILDVGLIAVLSILAFLLIKQESGPKTVETKRIAKENSSEAFEGERDWLSETETAGKEMEAAESASAKNPSSAIWPEMELPVGEQPAGEGMTREQPDMKQPLEYVGAASPVELKSASDFVTANGPDGIYSFMYPANYFYTGNYDASQRKYFLATADGSITAEIYEMPAPVQGNPYESANEMYGVLKNEFLEEESCPYVHQSDGVADDGYSRLIIGGPLSGNPSRAAYYCIAFNDTTAYVLKTGYAPVNHSGIGLDYTQTGYLMDCLYRGWSVSGSTYMLRSYEQYLVDDMGDKKPGES